MGRFVLNILDKLGSHWRNDLIDREINIGLNIGTKDCSDISDRINEILKEEKGSYNNKISVFTQRTDAREILNDILKLQTTNSNSDNFQNKLFNFGKEIFDIDNNIEKVENLSLFDFSTSIKLFIKIIHQEIQSLENLNGLEKKLSKTEEDSLFWLHNYLNLIQSNSAFKVLLEEDIRIIPNRYKEFISYEVARSFGTEETPLDDELIDILLKLNNNEDWKSVLVHDGIYIDFNEKCKFEELSQTIEENISTIQVNEYQNSGEGVLDKFKSPILDLIEWIEDSKNKKLAESYFSTFVSASKSLLFKLTVGNSNIGISAIKMLQDEESVNLLSKIQESSVSTKELSELVDVVLELGIDISAIKMLENKDNVNLLSKIQESSISTKDLLELVDIATELGSTELLKQKAKILREEKRNREFLYKVGEKVEEAIKNSLTEFNVEKISIGAFDLKISNANKNYFLEVKSYKHNSSYPFLFAPSQAKKVMLDESNYAICTMQRPLLEEQGISVEYVENNLLFAKKLSNEFNKGVEDLLKYNKIKNNNNISKLKFDILGELRIEVDKNIIIQKSSGFDSLIIDIRKELE